jgi:hypothetical protein
MRPAFYDEGRFVDAASPRPPLGAFHPCKQAKRRRGVGGCVAPDGTRPCPNQARRPLVAG